MLSVLMTDGALLEFASVELRDDAVVVLAAATQNGHALQYASTRLLGDKRLVLSVVRRHGYNSKAWCGLPTTISPDGEKVLLKNQRR